MYSGKGYCGFQKQENALSIQEALEKSFSTIYGEEISIVGCGRTDSGVHALQFYCHFDTSYPIPESRLFNINGLLGDGIMVQKIFKVNNDFHSRFDAVERSYEYRIHTQKNPFLVDSSFFLRLGSNAVLDCVKLKEVSSILLNYSDFNTFCKTNSDVRTTNCTLNKSEWKLEEETMIYQITADRFLRGMVRLIVGALLNVGMGKLSLEDIEEALKSGSRLKQDWSVPAHGLFLKRIKYPNF